MILSLHPGGSGQQSEERNKKAEIKQVFPGVWSCTKCHLLNTKKQIPPAPPFQAMRYNVNKIQNDAGKFITTSVMIHGKIGA